jgi:hypothetical protein
VAHALATPSGQQEGQQLPTPHSDTEGQQLPCPQQQIAQQQPSPPTETEAPKDKEASPIQGMPPPSSSPHDIIHEDLGLYKTKPCSDTTDQFFAAMRSYSSNSKLCIYADYMVAFGNTAWMYYIQKLNIGQYPLNRKHLSIKFGFKCSKQPLGSLHCRYYMCEHLMICRTYKVNREDVNHHCFTYLYFLSSFFIA